MASLLERLAARADWIDDAIEAVWWGKPESGLVVGRESDSVDLGYYAKWMKGQTRIPVGTQFVSDSSYPEFEFDLVAYRRPSWLRWSRKATVHRMKLGQGFA